MSNFKFLGNFLGKKASLPRDGHDMSNQQAYSLPFASIVPIDVIDVVPGEHYSCNYSGYIQTTSMRDDNFANLYSNMKAIYIPRASLLRNYADFITGERDTRKNVQFDYKPYEVWIQLRDIIRFLYPQYFLSKLYEGIISEVPDVYSCFIYTTPTPVITFADGSSVSLVDNNDKPLDAYRFCYSLYKLEVPNANNSIGSLFDKLFEILRTSSGSLLCHDALRLLDNLGYGNYLPLFEHAFMMDIAYLFSLPNGQSSENFFFISNDVDDNLPNFQYSYSRLQSLFPAVVFNSSDYVDMSRLFAYQFYIRMCEKSNYRLPSTRVITLDSISAEIVDYNDDGEFFRFSFNDHEFENDIYQLRSKSTSSGGSLPSMRIDYVSIFNYDGSSASFNPNILPYRYYQGSNLIDNIDMFERGNFTRWTFMIEYLFSLHNPLLAPDLFTTMQNSIVSGSIPSISGPSVNVSQLNELSALYKMRQDLLRAGVRRGKQMSTLFGVNEDTDLTQDIYILDSTTSSLNIQGLLNQAETAEAPLGERAARGNGSSGLSFEFDSKGYGILLVVQYITCESFYENFKVDKQVRTNVMGRWNPYFNNLGLESVYTADCSFIDTSIDEPEQQTLISPTNLAIGFSARYFEYKQRVSVVHGLFTNFGFNYYKLKQRFYGGRYYNDVLIRGNSLQGGFLPTLIDQQTNLFSEEKDLFFHPFMVNNLFVQMYDGASHGGYAYDNFRCIMNCSVKKVSPMPKLGLLRQL